MERLWNTLSLAAGALLLTLGIAIPLGILSAWYSRSWIERCALWISLLGLSLPTVLTSPLLLYLAFRTGVLRISGDQGWISLILPSVALAIPLTSFLARTLRSEMLSVLAQPYMLNASARGLPVSRLLYNAFRNAVNPVISLSGLMLGGLLSGAVVVEKIFNWPGLGSLMVDSILSRDLYVAVGCVLVGAISVILANLLADVVLAWNDPRIRIT